jgi:hypothetical protein
MVDIPATLIPHDAVDLEFPSAKLGIIIQLDKDNQLHHLEISHSCQ